MKTHKINKLYYGKYPYRIETNIVKGYMIKVHGVGMLESIIINKPDDRFYWNWTASQHKNKTDIRNNLVEYLSIYKQFYNSDDIKVRFEHNNINYYTIDENIYNDICDKFQKWIYSKSEPISTEELTKLYSKNNIVLCNRLPHNLYKYKIYIKSSMPDNERLSFLNWISNYNDSIRMPKSTVSFLSGEFFYGDVCPIYVKDEKLLTLVYVFLSKYHKKTQEFVLRNTLINNVSENESCPA